MKTLLIILTMLSLAACNTMQSSDPSSLFFNIPDGATLTLNRNLKIPQENTHALIQSGKSRAEKDKNEYEINCRFDVKNFGPRTIKPEVFKISRTEDGSEWFSYPTIKRFYTIMYLDSDNGTDIIKLECQQWGDGIDRNFTVAEMAEALGDYFSFSFNQNK